MRTGVRHLFATRYETGLRDEVSDTGTDAERHLTRVISPVDALQLVAKVMKVQPGAKPHRVGLVMPKAKDSNG